MGLFGDKKQAAKQASTNETPDEVVQLFNEEYRDELKASARLYFEKAINTNTAAMQQDIDATMKQVSYDIKQYMTAQLDQMVSRINIDINRKLDERVADYGRAVESAQELATQSLNRNAQDLHDRYQQLASSLNQIVIGQEAKMIELFEDSKARASAAQTAQAEAVDSLNKITQSLQEQAGQLASGIKQLITSQEAMMNEVMQENKSRVEATRSAQDQALQTLNQSASELQAQSEQLQATLQASIDNQKEIMTNAFDDNMARIIEHYLLEVLGEQYDLKDQLPAIIKQMEAKKQAIVDDMKL